jgi:hypothetical protein
MDKRLSIEIENERQRLVDLFNSKGSFLHPDVIECSKRLDSLILGFLIQENQWEQKTGEGK